MKIGKPQMTEEITNAIKDLAVGEGNGTQTFYSCGIFAYQIIIVIPGNTVTNTEVRRGERVFASL